MPPLQVAIDHERGVETVTETGGTAATSDSVSPPPRVEPNATSDTEPVLDMDTRKRQLESLDTDSSVDVERSAKKHAHLTWKRDKSVAHMTSAESKCSKQKDEFDLTPTMALQWHIQELPCRS